MSSYSHELLMHYLHTGPGMLPISAVVSQHITFEVGCVTDDDQAPPSLSLHPPNFRPLYRPVQLNDARPGVIEEEGGASDAEEGGQVADDFDAYSTNQTEVSLGLLKVCVRRKRT